MHSNFWWSNLCLIRSNTPSFPQCNPLASQYRQLASRLRASLAAYRRHHAANPPQRNAIYSSYSSNVPLDYCPLSEVDKLLYYNLPGTLSLWTRHPHAILRLDGTQRSHNFFLECYLNCEINWYLAKMINTFEVVSVSWQRNHFLDKSKKSFEHQHRL